MPMNSSCRTQGAFLVAVLCMNCGVLTAQTETATISGLVTDASGAAVAKAEVVLQSAERGTKMEGATNESGIYAFSAVLPGQYQLTVRKAGFNQVNLLGIVVNVQDHVQQNFSLQVGSVSESVTVDGRSETINTQSASVGTVVDRQFVENLPLNGRSFQSLITLTPGVVIAPGSGQFSVNGQRSGANSFNVDGVSADIGATPAGITGANGSLAALTIAGTTQSLVSVDALQEFRIETSTYSAEYGRQPGGQVLIVTRSGTNQIHGTAFEYLRNDALDANNWFVNAAAQPKAPERQNDFGGVLGGPVYIPHAYDGRNRTFFFFSYEGLRLRLPQFNLTNVPTLALRQQAPAALQPYLNAFPMPNGKDLGNGFGELSSTYSDPTSLDTTAIRIDHTFNSRLTVFGRFSNAPSQRYQKRPDITLSIDQFYNLNAQTATFGATGTITPTLVNEARFNYSYNRAYFLSPLDNFDGAVPPQASSLLPGAFDSNSSLITVHLNFPGFTSAAAPYLFLGGAQVSDQHQINFVNHLSYSKGNHQFRFGIDFRRLSPISDTNSHYSLSTTFSSQQQVIAGTAASGTVSAYIAQYPVFLNFSAFADDSWKVSRRLTINLGLRWDVNPPPTEAKGNNAVAANEITNLATMQLAPSGTKEWNTSYKNFAPRVGAAYHLFQAPGRETILRGGFGVFFDLGNDQSAQPYSGRYPFSSSRTLTNVVYPLNATQITPAPLPYLAGLTTPYSTLYLFDPNLKLPYTLQWNIAVEQSLGRSQSLSLSYVGAAGRDLLQAAQLNLAAINPNFTTVNLTRNLASSDYDALQARFQRRLSRGLQTLISYTWSHALDNDSASSTLRVAQRGNAAFDVRHILGVAATYDIPSAHNNLLERSLLRGWSIDTSIHAQSALPVDLVASTLTNPLDGSLVNVRPNLIPGVPLYVAAPHVPGGSEINRAAFSIPASGQSGSFGRNQLRGLGAWQTDFALRREFPLREGIRLSSGPRRSTFSITPTSAPSRPH